MLYSVPSRLIGQRLSIHLFDDRLDGYLGADRVVERPRVRAVGQRDACAPSKA